MNRGPMRRPGRGHGSIGMKAEKLKDTKGTLLRLWSYLAKEKKSLVLAVMFIVTSTLLGLAGPYLIARGIDNYILPKDIAGLKPVLAVLIGVYLLIAFFSWLQATMMVTISQNTVTNLRNELFEKIQTLPIKFFDSSQKGDLMSRVTNDIENISNTLSQTVTQLIQSSLSIIGAALMMSLLNWQLFLVTALSVPCVIFVVKNLAKFTRKYFGAYQGKLGSVNGIIEEDVSGIKTIKAYGQEDERIERFSIANKELRDFAIKAQTYSGLMGPSMNLTSNITFTLVVAFGAWFNLMGIISVGLIASFISYSKQFGRPLSQLAQLYNSVQSALSGAERVFDILDEVSEYEEVGTVLDKVEGNITFNNVHFSYEKGKEILKGIDFNADKGQSIALVGPTGAGKTTIINLISRFYDIDSGNITIDGHDLRDIDKNSIRKKLGVVLQDTYLFSGSVKENIRFGKLEATDEEIIRAGKMANAHDFIERLPQGYDTVLSENGSNLSEGQRQLLAIARALLADHDILILDEATSNVDTRTEKNIQDALLRLMEGKTSFIIAHRLSTIREADNILVIKEGKVEESGTHSELLEKHGFYRKLYISQFKYKNQD